MSENNFNGNPESGVDQFLNRTNSITPEEQVINLTIELNKANADIASITYSRNSYMDLHDQLATSIDKAQRAFADVLEGDTDPAGTMDTFSEVIEALGWEMDREIDVVITAEWHGTVTLKYGEEVSDVDLDFSDPTSSSHNLDTGWRTADWDISER